MVVPNIQEPSLRQVPEKRAQQDVRETARKNLGPERRRFLGSYFSVQDKSQLYN